MKSRLLSRIEALEKVRAGQIFETIHLFTIPNELNELPARIAGEPETGYRVRLAETGIPSCEISPSKI